MRLSLVSRRCGTLEHNYLVMIVIPDNITVWNANDFPKDYTITVLILKGN